MLDSFFDHFSRTKEWTILPRQALLLFTRPTWRDFMLLCYQSQVVWSVSSPLLSFLPVRQPCHCLAALPPCQPNACLLPYWRSWGTVRLTVRMTHQPQTTSLKTPLHDQHPQHIQNRNRTKSGELKVCCKIVISIFQFYPSCTHNTTKQQWQDKNSNHPKQFKVLLSFFSPCGF